MGWYGTDSTILEASAPTFAPLEHASHQQSGWYGTDGAAPRLLAPSNSTSGPTSVEQVLPVSQAWNIQPPSSAGASSRNGVLPIAMSAAALGENVSYHSLWNQTSSGEAAAAVEKWASMAAAGIGRISTAVELINTMKDQPEFGWLRGRLDQPPAASSGTREFTYPAQNSAFLVAIACRESGWRSLPAANSFYPGQTGNFGWRRGRVGESPSASSGARQLTYPARNLAFFVATAGHESGWRSSSAAKSFYAGQAREIGYRARGRGTALNIDHLVGWRQQVVGQGLIASELGLHRRPASNGLTERVKQIVAMLKTAIVNDTFTPSLLLGVAHEMNGSVGRALLPRRVKELLVILPYLQQQPED